MKKPALLRTAPAIEALEARIAPALLVSGGNLLGGAGNSNTGEYSVGENSYLYVKVLSGQAIVWFDGVIKGISMGPNTSIDIVGDVYGDIVTNLDASGKLTDSDNDPTNGLDGGKLLSHPIKGVTIHRVGTEFVKGSVRNIISGGSISGLNIDGEVQGIYAGDGAFHPESNAGSTGSLDFSIGFDINPIQPGTQASFTLAKSNASMTPGAGISASSIGEAKEMQVIAGSGNPTNAPLAATKGPAGGSIDGLKILKASLISSTSTNPAYELIAGDGASGKSGGAGGSITKLIEKSSTGNLSIRAGDGGTGSGGAGGAGGSIRLSEFGSPSGAYTLAAGNGGAGAPGGAGGGITATSFANTAPTSSLIAAGDLDGDGTDELVMVDASSGNFVVGTSENNGSDYELRMQFFDTEALRPVFVVDGKGTVTDLDIGDIDADGDNDVVVTIPASGSIIAYINDGTGNFYNSLDEIFVTKDFSYTDEDGFNAKYTEIVDDHFVVAAVSKTRSLLATVPFAENAPEGGIVRSFSVEVTALVSSELGDAYAGFSDGTVVGVTFAGSIASQPITLGGPVKSLAVGDAGTTLAALTADKKVTTFTLAAGAAMTPDTTLDLTSSAGALQQLAFIPDGEETPDRLVISRTTGDTSFDVYQRSTGSLTYSLGSTVGSDNGFKQFAVSQTADGGFGLAALTGAASAFGFSKNLGTFDVYGLPFNGKQVNISAGDGGAGLNFGNVLGKGGAGGSINDLNVDAVNISLVAGAGGISSGGAAGAGGGFKNSPAFISANGTSVSPVIRGQETLSLTGGAGGDATGAPGKLAAGGAGGGFHGLVLELNDGEIRLEGGDGGLGNGGTGGAGGGFTNIRATGNPANIQAVGGDGANTIGTGAKAGAGGGFTNFIFKLNNEPATETTETTYSVRLAGGIGGNSPNGIGGAGGGFNVVNLSLDGADSTYFDNRDPDDIKTDRFLDSTISVDIESGNGGSGVTGGKGGDIIGVKVTTVHDQFDGDEEDLILLHHITATVIAGRGGAGSTGDGGAGGSINSSTFTGVTYFDKDSPLIGNTPLYVAAGAGGSGGNKGGAGGSIAGLTAQNGPGEKGSRISSTHLTAAEIYAGDGGDAGLSDGGAGGSISGLLVGASRLVVANAGHGGNGGMTGGTIAKGGAGGSLTRSTLGLVYAPDFEVAPTIRQGLITSAGNGGSGVALGGAGGAIASVTAYLPLAVDGLGAIFTAGDGGTASGAGATGGKGGDITGITNGKDVHSAISLIEAGNGGNAAVGKGGAGGNVSSIRVAGFIGRVLTDATKLGAFDAYGIPSLLAAPINTNLVAGAGIAQGLFVGRGGTGATAGLAGSVLNVQAEAISAIGAAVDSMGVFALAEKVTSVKASFIGYDVNGNNAFDAGNPSVTRPTDGFILAKALSLVTGSRTGFVFSGTVV
jgi:hypothetical protein